MTVTVVTLKQLGGEIKKFSSAALDVQKHSVVMGIARTLPELAARSPVDTGAYASSWDFTADEKRAILGNYAPHAPVIEYGARPFTPPIGPLLAWAKRVLQDPSQPPDYSPDVWRLAKGTQAKIASEGMKPRHILRDALPVIIDNIRAEFRRLT